MYENLYQKPLLLIFNRKSINNMKVYHNPRCSKSRAALAFLDENSHAYETELYLKKEVTKEEILHLLNLLKIEPIELVRQKEEIWKQNYKGKNLTDDEVIEALATNPRLIERPIVIHKDKAVIARPTEKIQELF